MTDTKIDAKEQARKVLLHGIFTTALEGGIGYWSSCSGYHWALDEDGREEDLDGFTVTLHPTEGEWGVFDGDADKQPLTVDRAVIQRGLERYFERFTTDKRNRLGGPVQPDSDKAWLRDPFRITNEYRVEFHRAVTDGRYADVDYDADIADDIVQLGLFDSVVFG